MSARGARCGWDHLRVCGADESKQDYKDRENGSPPRVRSRLVQSDAKSLAEGITSACAEQTCAIRQYSSNGRDHLRVCGADLRLAEHLGYDVGSPPRVRSRLLDQ